MSAPAAITARTSSPRRAKSAESSDGEMRKWRFIGDYNRRKDRAAPGIASRRCRAASGNRISVLDIMAENKRYEITVSPKVTFLPEQSDPDKNHFVFAYTITVTNT